MSTGDDEDSGPTSFHDGHPGTGFGRREAIVRTGRCNGR
jgi:hypothetical protein